MVNVINAIHFFSKYKVKQKSRVATGLVWWKWAAAFCGGNRTDHCTGMLVCSSKQTNKQTNKQNKYRSQHNSGSVLRRSFVEEPVFVAQYNTTLAHWKHNCQPCMRIPPSTWSHILDGEFELKFHADFRLQRHKTPRCICSGHRGIYKYRSRSRSRLCRLLCTAWFNFTNTYCKSIKLRILRSVHTFCVIVTLNTTILHTLLTGWPLWWRCAVFCEV